MLTWIFLPIGIGIAIGLALGVVALAGAAVWFIIQLLLIPFHIRRSHRDTPEGRALWEAKVAAFRQFTHASRGTPERAAALARWRELTRVPAWKITPEQIRELLATDAGSAPSHLRVLPAPTGAAGPGTHAFPSRPRPAR